MDEHPHRALPGSVWTTFLALLIAAIALGVLYGTEVISALTFSLAVLGGLLAFVPWAVFHLDVRGLAELRIYRDD